MCQDLALPLPHLSSGGFSELCYHLFCPAFATTVLTSLTDLGHGGCGNRGEECVWLHECMPVEVHMKSAVGCLLQESLAELGCTGHLDLRASQL